MYLWHAGTAQSHEVVYICICKSTAENFISLSSPEPKMKNKNKKNHLKYELALWTWQGLFIMKWISKNVYWIFLFSIQFQLLAT